MNNASFEARLASIDLTRVMSRVEKETGWDQPTLDQAEDLYRKFLTLEADRIGMGLVPPMIVDEIWHAHVLHTRQYAADCELLFGQFLHHEPSSEDTTSAYEVTTVPAFAKAFGIDLRAAGCGGNVKANRAGASAHSTERASLQFAASCASSDKGLDLAGPRAGTCARSPSRSGGCKTVTFGPMARAADCNFNPRFDAGECA